MDMSLQKNIFFLSILLCLSSWVDPPMALLLGLILASTVGHPFLSFNARSTNLLLKTSIVGLGFGMNIFKAMEAGKEGFFITFFSIFITLILGFVIGRLLNVPKTVSYLISCGTAICGGSAIAAVGPIIKAKETEMSVALGVVFILNSIALLIFPAIGHYLSLTQEQFGIWAAIAIHDTSSVVGASAKFGEEALRLATIIKLERALWIIPLSFFSAFIFKLEGKRIKIPYFIFLYVLTMCIGALFPEYESLYEWIVVISKKGLTLTLFLIGAGLSLGTLKATGTRPLLQGVILWVLVSVFTLIGVVIN